MKSKAKSAETKRNTRKWLLIFFYSRHYHNFHFSIVYHFLQSTNPLHNFIFFPFHAKNLKGFPKNLKVNQCLFSNQNCQYCYLSQLLQPNIHSSIVDSVTSFHRCALLLYTKRRFCEFFFPTVCPAVPKGISLVSTVYCINL